MESYKIMVGNGNTIHEGVKSGSRYYTLCGAGANRTGRNVTAFAYPIEDGARVTCEKCQAKMAKLTAHR